MNEEIKTLVLQAVNDQAVERVNGSAKPGSSTLDWPSRVDMYGSFWMKARRCDC